MPKVTPPPMRQTLDVSLPSLRGILWALRFLKYTWFPLGLSILTQWGDTTLSVISSSCIALVIATHNEAGSRNFAIPAALEEFIKSRSRPDVAALLCALGLTTACLLSGFLLRWIKAWVHLILNRRITPQVMTAAIQGSEEYLLDAPTAVQRWLCKLDVVFFLTENVAAPIAYVGSIAIVVTATYRTNALAGDVAMGILAGWLILAWLLTRQALRATKHVARAHEDVGRIIRNGVSLRKDLSRPSLLRFWLRRSDDDVDKLQHAICRAGLWEALLGSILSMVARALPICAVLASMSISGVAASVAILLYLSRLAGPLESLAGILPWMQQNLISVQRIYRVLNKVTVPQLEDVPALHGDGRLSILGWSVQRGGLNIQYPDIRLSNGHIACLIGPSGSGKSAFLDSVAGMEPRATGDLLFGDLVVEPYSPAWREARALVPQETELMPGTIGDNLEAMPGWSATRAVEVAISRVLATIDEGAERAVDIDDKGVSVGQRRALSVLRALGGTAPILLLDEPIAGVDDVLVSAIRDAILEADAAGRLILIATHEHDYARLKLPNGVVIPLYGCKQLKSAQVK